MHKYSSMADWNSFSAVGLGPKKPFIVANTFCSCVATDRKDAPTVYTSQKSIAMMSEVGLIFCVIVLTSGKFISLSRFKGSSLCSLQPVFCCSLLCLLLLCSVDNHGCGYRVLEICCNVARFGCWSHLPLPVIVGKENMSDPWHSLLYLFCIDMRHQFDLMTRNMQHFWEWYSIVALELSQAI